MFTYEGSPFSWGVFEELVHVPSCHNDIELGAVHKVKGHKRWKEFNINLILEND